MNLQLALDTMDSREAVCVLNDVADYIHIIEIGTPMIIHYGMEPVRTVKEKFPSKVVLADTKIMDAGNLEAEIAFLAGANLVTVMGITHNETIQGAVKAAENAGGKIVADMMCVENLEERAKELVSLGVDYICVHTAHDVQGTQSPFDSLAKVQKAVGSSYCAIAGGINLTSISKVLDYKPEIIVVGNGITGQKNLTESAKNLFTLINR